MRVSQGKGGVILARCDAAGRPPPKNTYLKLRKRVAAPHKSLLGSLRPLSAAEGGITWFIQIELFLFLLMIPGVVQVLRMFQVSSTALQRHHHKTLDNCKPNLTGGTYPAQRQGTTTWVTHRQLPLLPPLLPRRSTSSPCSRPQALFPPEPITTASQFRGITPAHPKEITAGLPTRHRSCKVPLLRVRH